MVFDFLFGKSKKEDQAPHSVNPSVPSPFPEKSFGDTFSDNLAHLDALIRASSNVLSVKAHLYLTVISDKLHALCSFLDDYDIRAEEEYILDKLVTRYIPDTVDLFCKLDSSQKHPGGNADKEVIKQCADFEKNIDRTFVLMKQNCQRKLDVQTSFVNERLKDQR